MKKIHADLLLDASASMAPHVQHTLSGVTEYVQSLALERARVSVTLFEAGGVRNVLQLRRSVKAVKPKNFAMTVEDYRVGGMTPLFDAIGRLITERLHDFTDDKTHRVLVVFTDGMENCSREFTAASVALKLKEWEARGWLVLYLGANQDAILESSRFGLNPGRAVTMDMHSVGGAMKAASRATMSYHSTGGGVAGMSASAFTEAERKEAKGE